MVVKVSVGHLARLCASEKRARLDLQHFREQKELSESDVTARVDIRCPARALHQEEGRITNAVGYGDVAHAAIRHHH